MLAAAGCRLHRVTREVYWAPLSYLAQRAEKTLGPVRMARRLSARTARWPLPATLFDVLGVYAVRCRET